MMSRALPDLIKGYVGERIEQSRPIGGPAMGYNAQ